MCMVHSSFTMMVNKIRYRYGHLVNRSSLDTSIHIIASYETQMHKNPAQPQQLDKIAKMWSLLWKTNLAKVNIGKIRTLYQQSIPFTNRSHYQACARIWTTDLLITSEMRYHCATRACTFATGVLYIKRTFVIWYKLLRGILDPWSVILRRRPDPQSWDCHRPLLIGLHSISVLT